MKPALWKSIAVMAAIFAFVVSVLTIVNYLQIKRVDPINTTTINSLVDRLNQNPQDADLRNQIRELDLLVRKAYFTNQWQVRTGAYFLLISVALLIISLQMLGSQKKPEPKPGEQETEGYLAIQKSTRRWIAVGGSLLVGTALILTFLTHNELQDTLYKAAQGDIVLTDTSTQKPVEKQYIQEENTLQIVEKEVVEPAKAKTEEIIEKKAVEAAPEVKVKSKPKEQAQTVGSRTPVKDDLEAEMRKQFPAFRGVGSNGVSEHRNLPLHWDGAANENICWKVEIPLHGFNSPIIWGDKLFVSGANSTRQEVYCFDRNNGSLLWTAVVDQIEGSPEKAPDVTPDTGHAAPTLTTDGTYIYAIFSTGDVIALNMNGERVWARNLGLPRNHYGHASSLLLFEDKLLIQYDHSREAKVMALNTQTGETVWTTPRKVKVSWASPVLVNTGSQMELILAADPLVASYNPETGEEIWQLDCLSGEVGPSVVYADGVVFAMNEYASLVAIKLGESPVILWQADEFLSDVPSPVATDQYLFIATSYGVVACYHTKTGEKYWEQEFDEGFYSSMMLNGDHIYLIDKRGVSHIFKADKTYQEIATSPLGENVYATPAFSDGHLYIRAEKNLYCVGAK